jgi:excisionase family DNA binding protein
MSIKARPIEPNAIYTREEAADLLRIGLSTLKRWIANGELEVSRPAGSRRIMIQGASLLELVERTKTRAKRSDL